MIHKRHGLVYLKDNCEPVNHIKLGSVDNSSPISRSLADCPLDLEILLNEQSNYIEIERTGSREQVAGRRDINCQTTLDSNILFHKWMLNNHPFIYTRQPSIIPNGYIQLAFPKRNIVWVSQNDMRELHDLPRLHEVIPSVLSKLNPFVYGSFSWSYITKNTFTHSQSDLDLLFIDAYSLMDIKQTLYQLREANYRVDGEIRLAPFGDCSLIELIETSSSHVLFKNECEVKLVARKELYASFPNLRV